MPSDFCIECGMPPAFFADVMPSGGLSDVGPGGAVDALPLCMLEQDVPRKISEYIG